MENTSLPGRADVVECPATWSFSTSSYVSGCEKPFWKVQNAHEFELTGLPQGGGGQTRQVWSSHVRCRREENNGDLERERRLNEMQHVADPIRAGNPFPPCK